ncbi:MAG TPA: hypothetical protein VJC16_05120 [Candidatus Nanoarchaeia archaeon]|nr:hypothetical protein [Candidatus Nanoarchaeia archaeon]
MKIPLIGIIAALIGACILWNPLIVFVVPGVFLLFPRRDFIHALIYCIGASLAFWIAAAWFVRFAGWSLTNTVYVVALLSLLGIALLFRKSLRPVEIRRESAAVLAVFGVILLLRLLPMSQMIVAPGPGDMAEHTYPVTLIQLNDGLPNSYEPLLPIPYFGTYAVGFHTISGLFTLLSDIPDYRATFLMAGLVYVLLSMAVFVLVNQFFSKKTALITSLAALFLTTYPQLIFHWGGNPTAFSFFFVVLGMSLLVRIHELRLTEIVLSAGFLAAALLTHINPFLTFFYVYGGYAAYQAVSRLIAGKGVQRMIINLLSIVVIAALLLVPYFAYFELGLSADEREEFTQKYFDHTVFPAFLPRALENILIGPIQAVAFTSIPFALMAALGWVMLTWQRKRIVLDATMFTLLVFLMIVNAKYWILPFSFTLMTDRISLFFIIPFSFCTAGLVEQLVKRKAFWIAVGLYLVLVIGYFSAVDINYFTSPYYTDRSAIGVKDVAALAAYQAIGGPAALFMFGMENDSLITEADLLAFAWIRENTLPEDIFINDQSGKWIPVMTHRRILIVHVPLNYHEEIRVAYNLTSFYTKEYIVGGITTPQFNLEEFLSDIANVKSRGIKYVYIGKKYLFRYLIDSALFLNNPDYELVYNGEGVRIFKVR